MVSPTRARCLSSNPLGCSRSVTWQTPVRRADYCDMRDASTCVAPLLVNVSEHTCGIPRVAHRLLVIHVASFYSLLSPLISSCLYCWRRLYRLSLPPPCDTSLPPAMRLSAF